jgi:hypothetical protein
MIKKIIYSVIVLLALSLHNYAAKWVFVGGPGPVVTFATSANALPGIVNWTDENSVPRASGTLPGENDDLFINTASLAITDNRTFNSIQIDGSPGELWIYSKVTLVVKSDFIVSGILHGVTGAIINAIGSFKVDPEAAYADLKGVALPGKWPEGKGNIQFPAKVPVSPWSVVTVFLLIAGFSVFRYRRNFV